VPRSAPNVRIAQSQQQTSAFHRLLHLENLAVLVFLLGATIAVPASDLINELIDVVLAEEYTVRLLNEAEEELGCLEVNRQPGHLILGRVDIIGLLEVLFCQVSAKRGAKGVNVIQDIFLQLTDAELLQILPRDNEYLSRADQGAGLFTGAQRAQCKLHQVTILRFQIIAGREQHISLTIGREADGFCIRSVAAILELSVELGQRLHHLLFSCSKIIFLFSLIGL